MLSHELRFCAGCGASLQSEDPERSGYVPAKALEREEVICRRCHRIRHYNEVSATERTADDYRLILEQIASQNALVVFIVDVFDLEGSWVPGLPRFIDRNPLLLVVNKIDLLPTAAKRERLTNWLRHSLREWGVQPVDIALCSVKKNIHVDRVVEKIERHRDGRDVYVVGATNVGKSALLNRLLRDFGEGRGDEITTSFYPGTTLDEIRIPLDDRSDIIDTPGIVNVERLSELVSPQDLRVIVPKSQLRPKVYQLNAGQTLFFAGLARFDFKTGPKQPFVCYMAKDLYIHRTKAERADTLYEKQRGKLLSPPSAGDADVLPPFQKRSYRVKKEKTDIVIAGLGWITCRGDAAEIDVYAPKGVSVSYRPAII